MNSTSIGTRLLLLLHALTTACREASVGLLARFARRVQWRSARGDVPGWVMVTLMSALLVAGVYAVAGQALIDLFNNAITKVGGLK